MNKENDWDHMTEASMAEGPIKNDFVFASKKTFCKKDYKSLAE